MRIPKRKPVNLMPRLSEALGSKLKSKGITMVKVKHEGFITVYSNNIADVSSKETHRAVKVLENRDRQYITSILKRYYNTKDLRKIIMLEKEIDKLEIKFWNCYAWYVVRDWKLERIRDVKVLLKSLEGKKETK